MEREVVFSKRLYGVPGMALALIFTLGFLPQTARGLSDYPVVFVILVILIILAASLSTLGWRYCLRKGTLRWMRAYFGTQVAIAFIMYGLEVWTRGQASGESNFLILLVLQASVLPGWYTLAIGACMMVMQMLVAIPSQSAAYNILGAAASSGLVTAAILILGHLIVSEERARQQADEANRKLSEYALQAEALATANERNRIAREIHDNLGHYLSAVNMQIEASIAIIESDPVRAVQTLRKAQTLAKDGLSDIRGSVATLRADPMQSRPLHEAIARLVEEGQATGLVMDYRITGVMRAYPAEIELALYRIAQEGLTNVRKHAHATRVDLELCYDDDKHIRLKVQDNGQGSTSGGNGFGLLGIRERVKLLGGTVDIRSSPGNGFNLVVEIPV